MPKELMSGNARARASPKYPALLARFFSSVWALRPEDHDWLSDLLLRRSAGDTPTAQEIQAAIDSRQYGSSYQPTDGVAVLNLHGMILNRAGMLQASGITSPQEFAMSVREAAEDPNVREIVLSVDSPGGSVDGLNTAAEAVREAAKLKTVTAVADGTMASGAFWIASQASRIVADPTAIVGSIGVIATHLDRTKEAESEGVRVSYFRSVEHKALGQPYEPLTSAAGDDLRAVVMAAHREFVAAIEGARGPLSEAALSGRVFTGAEAVEAGLADSIGSLQSVLAGITNPVSSPRFASARPRASSAPTPTDLAAGRESMDLEQLMNDHPALVAQLRDQTIRDLTPERLKAARPDLTPAPASDGGDGDPALEQRLVSLEAENQQLRRDFRKTERAAIAREMLADAGLPQLGKSGDIDLDARFARQVEHTAETAETADAARSAVAALIEERRALLGATTDTRNTPGITRRNTDTPKRPQAHDGINRAMKALDL